MCGTAIDFRIVPDSQNTVFASQINITCAGVVCSKSAIDLSVILNSNLRIVAAVQVRAVPGGSAAIDLSIVLDGQSAVAIKHTTVLGTGTTGDGRFTADDNMGCFDCVNIRAVSCSAGACAQILRRNSCFFGSNGATSDSSIHNLQRVACIIAFIVNICTIGNGSCTNERSVTVVDSTGYHCVELSVGDRATGDVNIRFLGINVTATNIDHSHTVECLVSIFAAIEVEALVDFTAGNRTAGHIEGAALQPEVTASGKTTIGILCAACPVVVKVIAVISYNTIRDRTAIHIEGTFGENVAAALKPLVRIVKGLSSGITTSNGTTVHIEGSACCVVDITATGIGIVHSSMRITAGNRTAIQVESTRIINVTAVSSLFCCCAHLTTGDHTATNSIHQRKRRVFIDVECAGTS